MTELFDMLLEWEDRWRHLGAPVDNYLLPGADPAEVRDVLHNAGFATPQEVVDWFAWHNGALVESDVFQAAPSPFLPITLDDALQLNTTMREYGVQTAADIAGEGFPDRENPDFYWEPTWLSIGTAISGCVLTLELAPGLESCRVYNIDSWASGDDDYRAVRSSTLTEAVRTWISWLNRGDWTWSPEPRRGWVNDLAALPLEIRSSGLI